MPRKHEVRLPGGELVSPTSWSIDPGGWLCLVWDNDMERVTKLYPPQVIGGEVEIRTSYDGG